MTWLGGLVRTPEGTSPPPPPPPPFHHPTPLVSENFNFLHAKIWWYEKAMNSYQKFVFFQIQWFRLCPREGIINPFLWNVAFSGFTSFSSKILKDTKNSIQSLKNPKIFFAMAMAMSIYRKLCLLVSPKKITPTDAGCFWQRFPSNHKIDIFGLLNFFPLNISPQ